SEIVPSTMPVAEMLAKRPKAIILSGGPSSVYADGAPPAPAGLFDAGVPVLGICYGFQLMVAGLGGTVERTGAAEYGATGLQSTGGTLLSGTPKSQRVWMSHGDTCTAAPPGFAVTARTEATPVAAVEDTRNGLFGVQFHPEVLHTEHGARILGRFLELAGCRPSWTMLNIVEEQVTAIREQVGDGRASYGLSGGVDSALAGAVDAEQKRKIIGREFIRAFERAAREIIAEAGQHGEACDFLVHVTLYPDVVESGGGTGTANIKSHHNVGGLPDYLKFQLVEPLRTLFKDEVRQVGAELGLPPQIVWRQPFPGPGLAIRIVGEVTAERLRIV